MTRYKDDHHISYRQSKRPKASEDKVSYRCFKKGSAGIIRVPGEKNLQPLQCLLPQMHDGPHKAVTASGTENEFWWEWD